MTTEKGATTTEEKFFGIKHDVLAESPDENSDDNYEIVDDEPKKPVKATQDDDDDDLTSYSEKVQKRIKRMTWERGEEARRRETAESEKEEAIRFAQNVLQKNQQYENIINTGEARLVQEFKSRSTLAVQQARSKYAKAYEDGDTEAIIAAQEELINAQTEYRTAIDYEGDYTQRSQQFVQQRQKPQPAYRPPQRPQVPTPTPEASDWAEKNPWFGHNDHKDMTALAYGVHENLVRNKGIKPDTEEYYEGIDNAMRSRFPEYFDEGFGDYQKPHKKPATVVGSATRNNGTRPRKVKLTASQVSIAKRLGLTIEQYAAQLTKDM